MESSGQFLYQLTICLPIISSVVWAIMIGFSIADSNTLREKQVKWDAMWFYMAYIAMWTFVISYQYWPTLAVILNATGYLGIILIPVQTYRLICKLSLTHHLKAFSPWHYVLPVAVVGTLFIWSFFIPYDTQLGLIENRGVPDAAYPIYSHLFLSKPIARLLFTMVYFPLCLIRLYRYYREVNRIGDRIRRPARWVWVIMGYVVLVVLVTFFSLFLFPRGVFVTRWPTLMAAIVLLTEHIAFGYHIISRDFLLYSISGRDKIISGKNIKQENTMPIARNPDGNFRENVDAPLKLTRKTFDQYMKTRKPWLDPAFRLTDLVKPFGISRNAISAFVNRTYGVNFNRYLNRLRLQEMEMLAALPLNASKTRAELAPKAGFTNDRGYRRALEAEKNKATAKPNNTTQNNDAGHE